MERGALGAAAAPGHEPIGTTTSLDPPPAPAAGDLAALIEEARCGANPSLAGPEVLARLLVVEQRPDRFRRLMRMWLGKVYDAVARRDLSAASAWIRVVTRHSAEGEFAAIRDGVIGELGDPEFLESLAQALLERPDDTLAASLLGDIGRPAVAVLVEWMALDDPPVPRRQIVELLTKAGRADVRALAAHLGDDRWFVVRNVAIALGHTGRIQAVDPLLSALDHEDDRVRVEVLRSLTALRGDRVVGVLLDALADPSPRVRRAVMSLLRASPSPDVVPGLCALAESGELGVEMTAGIVELIAGRAEPAVGEALDRLAHRRAVGGARRAARDAARRALERRAS